MRHAIFISSLFAIVCGCSDSQSSGTGGGLIGSSPCEKAASLAMKVGCAAPTTCSIAAACHEAANQWLECVARDLAQCACEPDGDLNCEGSYKPNEGPAKCIAEHAVYGECQRCGGSSCEDAGAGD